MSDLQRRLLEDRAIRDAARAVLEADYAHLKSALRPAHLMDRVGENASGLFDQAVETAGNHRGAIAALLAAIGLWFARNPIMSLFENTQGDAPEPDENLTRSPNEPYTSES